MRPDGVSTLCRVADRPLSLMAHPLLPARGGCMRLIQLSRTVFAADLDGIAADRDLDRIGIEFAVAGSAGSLGHDVLLSARPGSGDGERTTQGEPAAITIFSDLAMAPPHPPFSIPAPSFKWGRVRVGVSAAPGYWSDPNDAAPIAGIRRASVGRSRGMRR